MICQNCQKEKKLRTKKLCHACYQGFRKNPEYKAKIFKKDLIGTSCKKCNKIRDKIEDIDTEFCRACYVTNLKEKNITWREKHKKICRDYQRKKRGIDCDLPLLNAPAGTGYTCSRGYRYICKLELRGHPNADKKGRMLEHIYIMTKHMGRSLIKGESIHHKNGIKDDNRIENLELWSSMHGCGQRVVDKIKWCIEFLNIYGYDVNKT